MSTQPQAGNPFSIAAELQPCRLLELPPDLLEYITSADTNSLHFKAPDASSSESFLCTSNKTYQLRQVHTSNSVYITTPTASSASDLDAPAITAISRCGSVLETLPAAKLHAKSILSSLLTPLNDLQDLESSALHPRTRDDVFAHTPMSHGECQTVWEDLMAFEYSSSASLPAQSFRPTATALVKVWSWLLELAHIHNFNLADRPVQRQAFESMLEGEDEWPRSLIDAIFSKLSEKEDQGSYLQKEDTIKWVGHNILKARQESRDGPSTMEKASFIATWKDALPEAWRNHVSIEMLGKSYKLSAGGKNIALASEHTTTSGTDTANPSKPAAAATTGGKRKWHEKFAAARKQGKPS